MTDYGGQTFDIVQVESCTFPNLPQFEDGERAWAEYGIPGGSTPVVQYGGIFSQEKLVVPIRLQTPSTVAGSFSTRSRMTA